MRAISRNGQSQIGCRARKFLTYSLMAGGTYGPQNQDDLAGNRRGGLAVAGRVCGRLRPDEKRQPRGAVHRDQAEGGRESLQGGARSNPDTEEAVRSLGPGARSGARGEAGRQTELGSATRFRKNLRTKFQRSLAS